MENRKTACRNISKGGEDIAIEQDFEELPQEPPTPDTLWKIHNIAAMFEKHGQFSIAEDVYQTTFNARCWVLGTEHPISRASIHSLANLWTPSKCSSAEKSHRQTLEIDERILESRI